MTVKSNLACIIDNIEVACEQSNRNPEEVAIIAVTKYVSPERALEAYDAGIKHFGENRDDGLTSKWEIIKDKGIWHFIGTLQTRKVRNMIDKVTYIHSLDRLSLAQEIDKRAIYQIKCFVQVNVSGEESKHGISPEEVIPFIEKLSEYQNIVVVGLMTMAPYTDDKSVPRTCFRKLKNIQTEIAAMDMPHAPCTELSMGMSNDYLIAIEEGATFVRIGTALVGDESKEGK
ncbi:YggS family pyridoxal phosphate-dependent enzyme [Bacillus sp. FSL K6-3431]|uniref:YggS family pyridoxal phosphate-dependent enzyme n=1 Tax=Bacillus sp. FSL K6-3431 TaxID=2921500 RepID=UPI0030FBCA5C